MTVPVLLRAVRRASLPLPAVADAVAVLQSRLMKAVPPNPR
jgi:hypothetical protein